MTRFVSWDQGLWLWKACFAVAQLGILFETSILMVGGRNKAPYVEHLLEHFLAVAERIRDPNVCPRSPQIGVRLAFVSRIVRLWRP